MDREELKLALKQLIIAECQKDLKPEDIGDSVQLIGGPLDFDSLDALQISLAIKKHYDKRIEGNTETRKALASIDALADFILYDKL